MPSNEQCPHGGAVPLLESPEAMLSRGGDLRTHVLDLMVAALVVALCGLCVVAQPARAAQTVEVRDGDTTINRISVRDQTRLRIEHGRILDVIGDVYDPQKAPGGRVLVLKDEEQGEVYLKPVPPASMRGMDGNLLPGPLTQPIPAIKLDVKTSRGTVGLLLQPADVVGDTLNLRVVGGDLRAAPQEQRGKSHEHVRAAKALTLAMAAPALVGEIPAQRLPRGGQDVDLWKEARFVLLARYEVPGLVGEFYELTNISGEPMVIDERELYRSGVVTVGVRRLNLPPGASTPVWIVRQAGAD